MVCLSASFTEDRSVKTDFLYPALLILLPSQRWVNLMVSIYFVMFSAVVSAEVPVVKVCSSNRLSNIEFKTYVEPWPPRTAYGGFEIYGKIILEVIVSPDGILKDIQILSAEALEGSTGRGGNEIRGATRIFDRAVLKASERWEFFPRYDDKDRCGVITLYITWGF